MEHALRHLIYDLVGDDPAPDVRDGAALALLRLLRAPYFEGGHQDFWNLVEYQGERTLGQWNRGDWKDRHPADLYTSGGRTLYKAVVVEPDAAAAVVADGLLAQVKTQQPDLWQRLMSPTAEQLARRRNLTLEVLDPNALDERLAQILGHTYRLDGSLGTQGMEYHSAPSYNDDHMRYILAHNGEEVAGILGLSSFRPWTYGVNYLAVAPAFRQRGVGRDLFARAIEECVKDNKVLVRTSPGEFAAERPAIPAGFDRQCQAAPLLHVQANSTLMSAVGRALERMSLSEAMVHYKPLCDRFDVGNERERWHNPELNAVIAALDATLPGTVEGARRKRTGP